MKDYIGTFFIIAVLSSLVFLATKSIDIEVYECSDGRLFEKRNLVNLRKLSKKAVNTENCEVVIMSNQDFYNARRLIRVIENKAR